MAVHSKGEVDPLLCGGAPCEPELSARQAYDAQQRLGEVSTRGRVQLVQVGARCTRRSGLSKGRAQPPRRLRGTPYNHGPHGSWGVGAHELPSSTWSRRVAARDVAVGPTRRASRARHWRGFAQRTRVSRRGRPRRIEFHTSVRRHADAHGSNQVAHANRRGRISGEDIDTGAIGRSPEFSAGREVQKPAFRHVQKNHLLNIPTAAAPNKISTYHKQHHAA